MKTKQQAILLAALAAALTACGGGDRDSSASGQDAARDDAPSAPVSAGEEAQPAPAAGGAEGRSAETDAPGAADMTLPDGVTLAMVEEGKAVFSGRGICMTCHGPDATGVPNLGGNLTDEEWIHSDGSYEGIIRTITEGVSAEASTVRLPMPPNGGSSISDDDVRAVAAYVWTLSN